MNLVVFIVGVLVGGLLYYVFAERKKSSAQFVIDFSDPMKDICMLVLYEDINDIYFKKKILVDVKVIEEFRNDSQK